MKLVKRILVLVCVLALMLPLAACGGDSSGDSGVTTITFMFNSSLQGMQNINRLVEEFNTTVGAEKGVYVKSVPKTAALSNLLTSLLPTNASPDVVLLDDRYFKTFTYYCEDLTDYISQDVIDDIYPESLNRYRYNPDTLTSNADDPLYAVPFSGDVTVLYYNQTALEKNGIICISVPEEQLEAFNNGEADLNGKTKADYGLEEYTIPNKGFYRSETPYVPEEGEIDGSSWSEPSDDEILVFNNQIAMSWDEMDDIAMICTETWNEESATQYGYYTEWWFNYGWSIGGDCIEDLTGDGDWVYTLPCDLPNYIVNDGCTYTGAYTGTVYAAGETLGLLDLIDAAKGAKIACETENDTTYYFTADGQRADERDLSAEVAAGTLTQLPSIQTALKRFYSLAGEGGKNVCPYPAAFGSTDSTEYFASGKLAFLVEQLNETSSIDKVLDDDFKYAPLPIYKTYTDPTDPNCDTVEKQGKIACHSYGTELMVSARSSNKEAAAVFLNWMASDGQTSSANQGHVSVRISDAETLLTTLSTYNPTVVVEALSQAKPGDWWYLPDSAWIDHWANPLNNDVRNGKISFEEFIYAYTDDTNEAIDELKN